MPESPGKIVSYSVSSESSTCLSLEPCFVVVEKSNRLLPENLLSYCNLLLYIGLMMDFFPGFASSRGAFERIPAGKGGGLCCGLFSKISLI